MATEFLLQLPDDIFDEIVKSPADAVGHLLHSCQPVAELWIHLPRLAAQQGGQFVQRRLHAVVEPLVNVPILVGESRAGKNCSTILPRYFFRTSPPEYPV